MFHRVRRSVFTPCLPVLTNILMGILFFYVKYLQGSRMKKNSALFLSLGFLTITSVGHSQPLSHFLPPDTAWVVEVSGGPSWTQNGKSQTFNLSPDIEKSYIANQSKSTLITTELFLGIQQSIIYGLKTEVGLTIKQTGDAKLDGMILDDADPQFANYNYQYKVCHNSLALKGKLLFKSAFGFTPWISSSAGIGFNLSHSFRNNPLIPEAVANTNFTENRAASLTYTLGAGIQKAINSSWRIGLGYEFGDWGKSQLSRAEGQTLNNGLSLSHFYTHSLLINLAYLPS
jgi:opacity protein-like surface antigen